MGNQITDIAKGHYNEILNREEVISKKRLQICKNCPILSDTMFGMMCDSKKYLDPKTNQVSYVAKDGYKKGCGCRLSAKTRVLDAKCPQGKW